MGSKQNLLQSNLHILLIAFFVSPLFQRNRNLFVAGQGDFDVIDLNRSIQLSWQPRIFYYKGFLSDEECDHLISLAQGKLKRSRVGNSTGVGIDNKLRTSSSMFLNHGHDEIVEKIECRIAAWTFLPKENGAPLEIARYMIGEEFVVHNDYFTHDVNLKLGNRVATVVMYLANLQMGGETFFPIALAAIGQKKDQSWSPCARRGYAVKPKKGDALLFFNLSPDNRIDVFSKHGGCPVIEGVKWIATKWIHEIPYKHNIARSSDEESQYDS